MQRSMLKSKLQEVRVTGKEIHYAGSLAIDQDLMEAAGLFEYEMVHVVDIDNARRIQCRICHGAIGRPALHRTT